MRAIVFEIRLPEGDRRWAIACGAIVELLPVVSCRPVVGGPAWAMGLFERRRMLMPLIDLSLRLGGPAVTPRLGSRVMLVRLVPEREDAGLGGLLIESTLGLETIDWETEGAHAGFACALDSPFGPVAAHAGTTVQLLHPERLLSAGDRRQLFPDASTVVCE